MKQTFLAMLIALTALTAAAKNRIIKNPTVEYTPCWICVNEIEFAKDATILRCDLRHRPHRWVELDGTEFLKDRNSDRTWKMLKVEGFELNKRVTMPDEGRVPCTLYFEPIPADVKEVNLMWNVIPTESDMFGIDLSPALPTRGGGLKDSSSKKKVKEIDPRAMTAEWYLNQTFMPDNDWHFSPERYRDMKFYNPGRAHVEIQIDHLPKELRKSYSSISVSTEDQILRKKTTLSSNLDDQNRYVFDIDLAGPMIVDFDPFGDYFIQPGDTLEIFTTAESDPYGEPRYTAFRSNSETAMINALKEKMLEKLGVLSGANKTIMKAIDNGKESSEKLAEEWGEIIERILTSEDARQTLINTPLSTFGKDLMLTYALADMGEDIENIHMYYNGKKHIREQAVDGQMTIKENPDFVPLDKEIVYAPMLRHRELFYDNPLALCTGWQYINRTLYGGLFDNYEFEYDAEGNVKSHKEIDPFGVRGTFMYNLGQSQFFASSLEYIQQNVQLGKYQPSEALDLYGHSLADNLAKISYTPIAVIVLNEYRALVARLEGGKKEADEDKWTAEQMALWKRITAPFEGNLLFVDFWGMSCGPCRAGMISMRDKVETLKDDNFRFLYVCDEKYSPRAEAEAWMTENNIRGEHIYVTHDEWNQLQQMFNFTGIPHAALADKQGKIIQNGFFISNHSAEQLRSMIEQF